MKKPALFIITRSVFKSPDDIFKGHPPIRTVDVGFEPCSLDEAYVLRGKLAQRPTWMNQIVQVGSF
jgi:hypothetical protein